MTDSGSQTLPSRQSGASQLVDAVFLLALLFVTLFVTTFVIEGDSGGGDEVKEVPISQLDISEVERQQFETLKSENLVDDASASALVEANAPSDDKYDIAWGSLILTVALALLYLGFVYTASFREFREVIAARFGSGGNDR